MRGWQKSSKPFLYHTNGGCINGVRARRGALCWRPFGNTRLTLFAGRYANGFLRRYPENMTYLNKNNIQWKNMPSFDIRYCDAVQIHITKGYISHAPHIRPKIKQQPSTSPQHFNNDSSRTA